MPLVRRLKVSPVFGFLVVGLAIGPHGLARFSDKCGAEIPRWLRAGHEAPGDRARIAAELAVSNPLLADVTLTGARGVPVGLRRGHVHPVVPARASGHPRPRWS